MMQAKAKSPDRRRPAFKTWLDGNDWRERILTLDPSWYLLCMGTGIIIQLLTNFPYPATWLRNLGYCFWVLDIVLFILFSVMGVLRVILYPKVAIKVFDDFTQTSYLGTIPIALDTIVAGLAIFYHQRSAALWASFGLFWACVALTVAVGFIGAFVMSTRQGQHKLEGVNGIWLLTFIPMIVTAATGTTMTSYLPYRESITVLVVSFFMWSLGVAMSYLILVIYFWRLMSHKLPQREMIISCFVPVGPLGMGAYAIQGLATGLASQVRNHSYTLTTPPRPPIGAASLGAVAEAIHWAGIILALFLLGVGTFFLFEALASLAIKFPRNFNIGFWSIVFPCGVYANALCRLATDLRNGGLRVYASIWVMFTMLVWLGCALETTYKGVWQAKLFFAPGLQGWMEHEVRGDNEKKKEEEEQEQKRESGGDPSSGGQSNGQTTPAANGHITPVEQQDAPTERLISRMTWADGTYAVQRHPRSRV